MYFNRAHCVGHPGDSEEWHLQIRTLLILYKEIKDNMVEEIQTTYEANVNL